MSAWLMPDSSASCFSHHAVASAVVSRVLTALSTVWPASLGTSVRPPPPELPLWPPLEPPPLWGPPGLPPGPSLVGPPVPLWLGPEPPWWGPTPVPLLSWSGGLITG